MGENPASLESQGWPDTYDLSELDRSRADPRVLEDATQCEVYTEGAPIKFGATIVGYDVGKLLAPIGLMMTTG